MANIKSKEKNIRRIEKNTFKNKVAKSRITSSTRKAKEELTPETIAAAHKAIDKAVSKGVIHKNTGANRKSKLDKTLSTMNVKEVVKKPAAKKPAAKKPAAKKPAAKKPAAKKPAAKKSSKK